MKPSRLALNALLVALVVFAVAARYRGYRIGRENDAVRAVIASDAGFSRIVHHADNRIEGPVASEQLRALFYKRLNDAGANSAPRNVWVEPAHIIPATPAPAPAAPGAAP